MDISGRSKTLNIQRKMYIKKIYCCVCSVGGIIHSVKVVCDAEQWTCRGELEALYLYCTLYTRQYSTLYKSVHCNAQ